MQRFIVAALCALTLVAVRPEGRAWADPEIDPSVLEISLALRAAKMSMRYSDLMAARVDFEDRETDLLFGDYLDALSAAQTNLTRLKGQTVFLMRAGAPLSDAVRAGLAEMAGLRASLAGLEAKLKAANRQNLAPDVGFLFVVRDVAARANDQTAELLAALAPIMTAFRP